MGKPKAPTPPDPAKTAAAQTNSNLSTAQANAILGNVNQVTPDGSLTYSKTGQSWIDDPNGQVYYRNAAGEIKNSRPMTAATTTTKKVPVYMNQRGSRVRTGYRDETVTTPGTADNSWSEIKGYYVPSYTATQTLSPQQQAIKDQTDAAELNLGSIANERSDWLKSYLAKPFNISNEATEARLMELGRKRLDPVIAQRDEQLRNRLANQGIKAGSGAYGQEVDTFNQGTNDAYNSLLLQGRGQAVQEALTERNQPLNEILALLGGSQVSQPSFVNANMPTIPTTDTAGIINENFNQQMGIYQQKAAQSQGILGGLFGLGAAGIKASDRRLKKDIKPIGNLMGEKIYSYKYKGGNTPHVGVMAQDIERRRPDAIVPMDNGYKAVNYGKLFELGASA